MTQPPSGQPQPCPRCKQPIEGSVAVHYAEHHGEYIPLHLERQGQPQQEPYISHTFVEGGDICFECGQQRSVHPDQQERQAGGHHVHERGDQGVWYHLRFWKCRYCSLEWNNPEWKAYEQGVADAAARER